MAGWMVLATIFLFLMASSVGCYPGKQHASRLLTAAAIACMALTAIISLALKENMFLDMLAVPPKLWLRALASVVVCVGLSVWLLSVFNVKKR